MNKVIAVIVGLALLALLVLFSTTYTIKFNEVAIKATFGQADEGSIIREPGMHARLPVFIDKVTKLDTRLQLVESPLEEITTADGLQIVVRAYLLWRVDTGSDLGPLDFFRSFQTIDGAQQSLRGEFRTSFTGVLSTYDFPDLIGERSRLADAEEEIRGALVTSVGGRGVMPAAVGISQVVLPPRTSTAVLERMKATREVLAQAEELTGTSEAAGIRSEAKTQADKIRSFASQRADEIRAQGEEEAAKYLEQMSVDPELATFLVWLDTLEQSLNRNTTVILPTRFEPFHLLDPTGVTIGDSAIPQPRREGTGLAPTPDPPAPATAEGS